MGRPTRVDDDDLVATVLECANRHDRGWATTAEIAAELPLERDSTRKRLNRAVETTTIERWRPHDQGLLWRVTNQN
jgi:hypothetical protein